MAMTDVLSGTCKAEIDIRLARTGGEGHTGVDSLSEGSTLALTDGSSSNQATGFFSAQFTATTDGITIGLGDVSDPLGAAGDDAPTEDPDGKDLRAILIENLDDTNYITVSTGTNALAGWLVATDEIVIRAGGVLFQTFPVDGVTIDETGSADEIKITANTASCAVQLTYVFG